MPPDPPRDLAAPHFDPSADRGLRGRVRALHPDTSRPVHHPHASAVQHTVVGDAYTHAIAEPDVVADAHRVANALSLSSRTVTLAVAQQPAGIDKGTHTDADRASQLRPDGTGIPLPQRRSHPRANVWRPVAGQPNPAQPR
jgi:hypothetical protein